MKISTPSELNTQSNFRGAVLRVSTVPYAHHVQARAIPSEREDWSERNQYEGYYGYEMEMLEGAREALGFEYVVTNPPDQGGNSKALKKGSKNDPRKCPRVNLLQAYVRTPRKGPDYTVLGPFSLRRFDY